MICTVFPHFGPLFLGGGGVQPNFADRHFMDTQSFLKAFSAIPLSVHIWGLFLKPQPPHTRQKYEQEDGPQTAEFAFFEAFGVIMCPDVCS